MQESIKEIAFLAQSPIRVQILEVLRDSDWVNCDQVKQNADGSRTTRQRNLKALEDHGLIESSGRSYRFTPRGELVAESFFNLIKTNQIAQKLSPFLEWIPSEEFDLDTRLLADAEITVAKENNPYAPVNKHVEALRSATEVRALLSVIGRDAMEVVVTRLEQREVEYELITDPDCVDLLQTDPHFEDLFSKARGTDRFDVLVYDGDIPYYLGTLDETVQIGVEDDDGIPRALIESKKDEIRRWAEQTYRDYRDQATPLIASVHQ